MKQLHEDGIAEYKSSNSDLEITFLVPREDERTINPFAKRIQDLNAVKQENMAAMLGYIQNIKVCRSTYLLNYFGENSKEKCGTCDICTKKDKKGSTKKLEEKVIAFLKIGPSTSRKLEQATGASEKMLLKTLRRLLEDEVISLNQRNEYTLED